MIVKVERASEEVIDKYWQKKMGEALFKSKNEKITNWLVDRMTEAVDKEIAKYVWEGDGSTSQETKPRSIIHIGS